MVTSGAVPRPDDLVVDNAIMFRYKYVCDQAAEVDSYTYRCPADLERVEMNNLPELCLVPASPLATGRSRKFTSFAVGSTAVTLLASSCSSSCCIGRDRTCSCWRKHTCMFPFRVSAILHRRWCSDVFVPHQTHTCG